MSRPLTGSKKQTATGWQVSLPSNRGSVERTTWTFRTETAADRWLDAAKANQREGLPLRVPAAADLSDTRRRAGAVGTSFQTMGEAWASERYEELWLADFGREETARSHVRRISGWMEAHAMTMELMVRDQVKEFQKFLTRRPEAQEPATVPDVLDPTALVTRSEALALPGMTASLSTLKRRIADGVLTPAATPPTGGHLYRIADIFSEDVMRTAEGGLKRGPRRRESLSQRVVSDAMWVYNEVCLFATDYDVAVPQDRQSLRVHRTDRPKLALRRPISLVQTGNVAAHLHAVHQLVLWLMRVLGLRIGEAFGIRVGDVVDNGPGAFGIVYIKAQGGRTFYRRDRTTGAVIASDRSEKLKTRYSYRVLVVPPALMELLRAAIRIFHTAPDGAVRVSARLIPGLQKYDAAGQAGFRTALAAAARAEGIDCTAEEDTLDGTFSCTPHDMRRGVMTDLDVKKIHKPHANRFAGHAAGPDVHDRLYVLDDPELKPMRGVAEEIQQMLDEEVGGGLIVATTIRCTTGNQKLLAADAARIDAELTECGWLRSAADQNDDPLLSADEAADELDSVSAKTVRQWMREGLIPAIVVADGARGKERRRVRLSDVLILKAKIAGRVTLRGLADEMNQSYNTVFQYVHAQDLELEEHGERGYLVPAATAKTIRDHYDWQAALHARAVPLSVAAVTLEVSVDRIVRFIAGGVLTADDCAHGGRRMVTRASVETLQQKCAAANTQRRARRGPRTDLIAWDEACTTLGLSNAQADSLVAEGVLVREQHQRRRHLTNVSILTYLITHAPERLIVRGV